MIAGLIGFFTGLSGQAHWEQWMLFRNAQPFGANDPEFGVDVGFYIFKYPFWRYLLDIGFTATDELGLTCSGEVTVGVPTSRNGTAVDEGPHFDSTVPG